MTDCLISLGSNLGDRRGALDRAVAALDLHAGVTLVGVSGWHDSTPVGGPAGQGGFLNGAARLETELAPAELLALLQQVEQAGGRERSVRWSARTLDVDLLLFGKAVVRTPSLRVPHPRMTYRPFVMQPSREIAPAMLHPELDADLSNIDENRQTGADAIRLAGEEEPRRLATEQIMQQCDAWRTVESATGETWLTLSDRQPEPSPPKLQVLASVDAIALPGVPVVPLHEQPEARRAEELAAAVACVWPGLGL